MKKGNFEHKGIIEKCISFFLAYPFFMGISFLKKKKRHYGMEGLNFCVRPVLGCCNYNYYPKQYLNQNIARNWAISPNLGQKIKSCSF